MKQLNLRRRLAVAGTTGITALIATMGIGAGVAAAAPPADPAGGSVPVAPSFNNGNVEAIRGSGSDTTFFVMQKLSDLYTGAGLYGCVLNSGSGQTLYNSLDPASSAANQQSFCQKNANVDTTDAADNWNRTEVSQGVDDVGSGAGQNQLCGTVNSPIAVDFARSSKPAGTCSSGTGVLAETGFAKDGVPAVDFQSVNPSSFGTTANTSPYATVNGGSIGPVAKGWLPGDPVNGTANHGTAFSAVANNDSTGGAASTAYRLWCATDSTRITDWGQLTNLGPNLEVPNVTVSNGSTSATVTGTFPASIAGGQAITDSAGDLAGGTTVSSVSGNTVTLSQAATGNSSTDTLTFAIGSTLAVGSGAPIGLPIRIQGVNPSSGTVFTFSGFVNSGVSGGGCVSNANVNAGNDPNPATAPIPNSAHIALENNSSQVSDFAANDFPADLGSQATEVATTLYFESNGVYNSVPFSASANINGTTLASTKLNLNTKSTTTPNLLNNLYPTARALFNIYRTDNVRASTGGFLNWICDSQSGITKGKDNSTGLNFDAEVNTLIGSFGFIRLTDSSSVPSVATPADGIAAPNTTCASGLNGGGTAGNGTPAITAVVDTQR